MANRALKELSPIFKEMYSRVGRRSIAPEKLLRSLLIQILYSIRSERMLVEQLEYNLLFRWFVGLSMDEPIWNHSTYSKNRDRILGTDITVAFLCQLTGQAEEAGLLSDEHFTVDGTLIEAWASLKSFRPRNTDSPDQGGGQDYSFQYFCTRKQLLMIGRTHQLLQRSGPGWRKMDKCGPVFYIFCLNTKANICLDSGLALKHF